MRSYYSLSLPSSNNNNIVFIIPFLYLGATTVKNNCVNQIYGAKLSIKLIAPKSEVRPVFMTISTTKEKIDASERETYI